MPWLQTQSLVLGYGRHTVTPEPLSLTFAEPGIGVLLGRNGAGKTSFLRAILGEPVIRAGSFQLFGEPALPAGSIGYVDQDPVYPGHLLLEDALKLAFLPQLGWRGRTTPQQNAQTQVALERFGLEPLRTRALSYLSPGERQRAFLARSILQSPKLLLLDEPTNHLDPHGRRCFWEAVRIAVKDRGCRVLVSTHDLEFARLNAKWVTAFEKGRIAYHGPATDFWKESGEVKLFGD